MIIAAMVQIDEYPVIFLGGVQWLSVHVTKPLLSEFSNPSSIRLQLFSKCSFNPMSVIGYDVG